MSNHLIVRIVLPALLCAGCATSVPLPQVQLVGRAFQDLNAASAPLFDDMAIAERTRGIRNADIRAKRHTEGAPAGPPGTDPCPTIKRVEGIAPSVQNGFCIDDSYYYSELTDPPATATFRRSLKAVESYTNVLLILAEGRNVEAAQAEVQGLAANVGGLIDLAGGGGIGTALTGLSTALKPVLEIAAKRANAKELARNVKEVSPKAAAVIEQLRLAAPEMFTTLTQRSLARLNSLPAPSVDVANAEAARIDAYRVATSNYVVLLGQYQQLLAQLVQSYDTEGRVITLNGLLQRSAELSAQADAWRRTYSALRMGL